jgi:coenzyme F420-reducing hydrogenase alpha subunit
MSTSRSITVKALARVEGEGALRIRVEGDRIEIAEFNIYEPPRFFEKILVGRSLREVPDIVARICGICPVAYQMTACHALEHALEIEPPEGTRTLRRLLYCGEWIQSHALHVHLLHAPDFLGYESGFTMAVDHPALVEAGFRLKGLGNRIMEVVGGRAVHPVNVAVGGFHVWPDVDAVRGLVPDLVWGLDVALDLVERVSGFDFPPFERPHDFVALRHEAEYPFNEGRIVSSDGLDISVDAFPDHFEERQVSWSTALHAVRIPSGRPYSVGPLARLNLCRDRLPPRAALAAARCEWPMLNPFRSIIARAIEIAAACEDALELARAWTRPQTDSTASFSPRAAVGSHATEAPRGLLWHRYSIDADGLVSGAAIIPPTSQNQARIEADLRAFVPQVLPLDDAAATLRCEQLIRSYDPCISCATHFLRLSIDRKEASVIPPSPSPPRRG